MKINFEEKYEFNFPVWAVCAWEYGEDEGFNPYTPAEDIKAFRKFQRRMERDGFSDVVEFGDEEYFYPFPEFGGGACDCVKATFYKIISGGDTIEERRRKMQEAQKALKSYGRALAEAQYEEETQYLDLEYAVLEEAQYAKLEAEYEGYEL